MKQKLLMLVLVLASLSSYAQITLGTGTTQTGYVPTDTFYGYNYSQQIFTQQEIGTTIPSSITSLSFYLPTTASLASSNVWSIHLGHTTQSTFSSETNWQPLTQHTNVFNGEVTNTNGVVTIPLTTPFVYNSTDNLILTISEVVPSYPGSANRFYNYSGVTNSTLAYRNDSTSPFATANLPTGTLMATKSIITFHGLNYDAAPGCPTITLPVANATNISAKPTITWSAATRAVSYTVSIGTTPGGTDLVNEFNVSNARTYTPATALPLNTMVYVTVTAHNSLGSSSDCTGSSFTTGTTVACPALTFPTANATNISLRPYFTYSASTNASHYLLSIGTSPGVYDVLEDHNIGSQLFYSLSAEYELLPDTNYYYIIKGANGTVVSTACTERMFKTTVHSLPDNDECVNATILEVNEDLEWNFLTPGTTNGASASLMTNSCIGMADDDVWYSFVATATTHILRFSNLTSQGTTTSTDIYAQLLSGTCGELTSLICSDNDTTTSLTSLTVGETYYLKVYSYVSNTTKIGFNIGIGTLPTAPENDNCINAEQLIVNGDLEYSSVTAGTTMSATNSNVDVAPCTGVADDDVWYSFIAESTAHTITLKNVVSAGLNSSTSLYAQVFGGTCENFISIGCITTSNTSTIIGQLTPNNVYYVRVYNLNANGTSYYANTFEIGVGTPPAAPDNDECIAAIELPVNEDLSCGNVTSATTNYATPSLTQPACTSGNPDDDVWFSFVATSQFHQVKLSNIVSVGTTTSTDMYLQVVTGTCEAYTAVICSDDNTTNLMNLTPGNTYYLRAYSYGAAGRNMTFNICIGTYAPTPANDSCSQAEILSINGDLSNEMYTDGTTFAATNSNVEIGTCTGAPDDDVWYTFTAESTSHTIVLNNITSVGTSSSTALNAQIFSGNCEAFTSIICHTTTTNPTVINNLTPGNDYYVRVYNNLANTATVSYWNKFRIAIGTPPSPPENDECTAAIELVTYDDLATTDTVQGTTYYATESLPATVCTTGIADDDVWYSFVATSPVHRVQLSNLVSVGAVSSTNIYLQILTGSCGSMTSVSCSDSDTGATIAGLIIGQTYYARVYSSLAARYIQFDIRIGTPPPPPMNDECSGAIVLQTNPDTSNTNLVNSNTLFATQSNVASCSSGNPDDDVWHQFVATETTHHVQYFNITSTGTSSTTDLYFQVLSGSCGELLSVLCSDSNTGAKIENLVVGNTYYVRTYTYSSGSNYAFSFNIRIGSNPPPPANDNCINAISLVVQPDLLNTAGIIGDTNGATASGTTPVCTLGNADDDVWYSFEANETSHVVIFENLASTGMSGSTDLYFQVLTGDCTNGLTSILCSDSNTGATIENLVVGQVYYVRPYTYSNGSYNISFKIGIGTIPAPPINDDCINAIALIPSINHECINPLTFSTAGATPSIATAPTCSASGINDDIWFSFEAIAVTHLINVAYTNNATAVQVYSGSCDGLVTIGCVTGASNTSNILLNNLNIGDTYYARVYSTTSTAGTFSTFNICIITPSIPENDDCNNASNIDCGETLTTNTIFAQNDVLPASACGSTTQGYFKSIWYTTTAINSGPLTISSCGSSYDTYLRAFTGDCGNLTCVSNSQNVGYSDDNCSSDSTIGNSNASKMTFNAEAGTTYYILLGAYGTTTVAGHTQISVTSSLGCEFVGIDEPTEKNQKITLYPNPFNNVLNISDITDVTNITIIDMLGRVSKSITKVTSTLHLDDLTSGMYFVQIEKADGSKQTIKTIKN